MIKTPLEYMIASIREKWLYKNSSFIYPYKFGIEDPEIEEEYGEYYSECLVVTKDDHEVEIRHFKMEHLFDALFVDTDRFSFLISIEAKRRLLQ